VRGDPEHVNSAVRALAAVGSEMRDYRGTMRQVRTRLRLLDALVTMQIDAKLCDQLIPGSERLLESVEQAERATRRYADELRWIHREAARITASLDAALSEIRTHMRRVAVIADAIAVPMRNPWDLPVQATMPEPQ